MSYPEFFAVVPRLTLHDPLAEFLGAADNGLIEYGYTDAVKLAGHSCPTVAGAYLMTLRALAKLYPDCLPERGGIRVELHAAQADGTAGVTAAVAGLFTGAAGEGGFKGLGGRFSRRNLLVFAAGIDAELRFTRLDTGARVAVAYHPEVVPAPPELQGLMPKLLAGATSAAEKTEFGRLWQMRVKRILIDHFDDPELVVCREIPE
ncbi:MAG: FmdE family protein [Rhodoferax sp.]|uniref:FmdE family protein n=1 Tax=Rhodoferax sp. TaxID=50421 RepID=UPI002730ED1A|nr:FmdE family protein [Rhodoferax sp.]MDP1529389.1 FmdE family protein [Rhodoferax sp.]